MNEHPFFGPDVTMAFRRGIPEAEERFIVPNSSFVAAKAPFPCSCTMDILCTIYFESHVYSIAIPPSLIKTKNLENSVSGGCKIL